MYVNDYLSITEYFLILNEAIIATLNFFTLATFSYFCFSF